MTNLQTRSAVLLFTAIVGMCFVLEGARSQNGSGPDPREIPVPAIRTAMKPLPGVKDLPVRAAMPDVMLMNDGTRVTTPAQWRKRRVEMKRILEYYFAGLAPPAPSNVKGREIKSQMVLDGKVKYRLIHLTFGPKESLGLDIGVFTPVTGGPFPALIMPGGTPPGATALPCLPQGPGQGTGVDALLAVGSDKPASPPGPPADAETIAARNPALAHGFAFVTFNNNDCGEDTTCETLTAVGRFARRGSIQLIRIMIGVC